MMNDKFSPMEIFRIIFISLTLFLLGGGGKTTPQAQMREKWKIGAGRRPALFFTRLKFSFACSIKNLGRFHAQNRFSEGFVGGESEISYKLWKNWKCHCFFKNASITFIFGHKFIYDNINILKIIGQYLGSLWRHYDVIPDYSAVLFIARNCQKYFFRQSFSTKPRN